MCGQKITLMLKSYMIIKEDNKNQKKMFLTYRKISQNLSYLG
jgi:hypothetical protein